MRPVTEYLNFCRSAVCRLFVFLLFGASAPIFAQQNAVDSLKRVLAACTDDSTRIIKQLELGWAYYNNNSFDSAIGCSETALQMSRKLTKPTSLGGTYNLAGSSYLAKYNFPEALRNFTSAMRIYERNHNKSGMSTIYTNMGVVYMMQEDYPKALDYFFKGLDANAELGDKWGVSTDLGNIAIIYQYQGDLTNSLIYSEKSLKMSEELNDKEGIVNGLSNLGSIYASQAEKNPSSPAATSLYKKALDYFMRAQKVADEITDINRSAMNQVSMGDVYMALHDYKNARQYFSEGARLAASVGELTAISGGNEGLSKVYGLTKKFDSALVYYKKYILFRDSIFNEENIKKTTQAEMELGFHKKLVSDSVLVAEEKKVAEAELHSEKNKQMSLYGGLALVLLFAGFIYQRFRITQKQKKIIEEQKILVEQQKYAVEEKQKQVTDSIQYAKRIQDALLPSERFISRYLNKK